MAARTNPQPGSWHTVGGAGEPAFLNGWANFNGATHPVAGFRKHPDGTVELRGLIKDGIGAPIFTLPVGYRPAKPAHFTANSNTGAATFFVDTNGDVTWVAGGTGWFSLIGARFPT